MGPEGLEHCHEPVFLLADWEPLRLNTDKTWGWGGVGVPMLLESTLTVFTKLGTVK